jgi:type II secretory ATPase GspE/PulE/Tfp pilus assembly ATPase PilB-like protein
MSLTLQQQFRDEAPDVARTHPEYVLKLVDAILTGARNAGASDVHLLPGEDGLAMSWRVDGVLHPIDLLPRNLAPNVVARLKVLAQLLTYQTDVPQEGRIHLVEGDAETRVSTFPTLFGEKCVIRLFAGSNRFRYLDDLGFTPELALALKTMLERRGGVILITGPAGSGKTTSIYACLREIVERAAEPRSVATLEDPVEAVMPGVAQSQIRPIAGFDYETGLKSLLRQDPEVIAVGEIRDRVTAQIAVQAALTGHLILTTFHAGSAAEAINRLLEMGLEPYQVRSALIAVLNQRLFRRLCDCATTSTDEAARLGLAVQRVRLPVGCEKCRGTGYLGRFLIAEFLIPEVHAIGRSILDRDDAIEIERKAIAGGMKTRWQRACDCVSAGLTSPAEIRRVLGFESSAEGQSTKPE